MLTGHSRRYTMGYRVPHLFVYPTCYRSLRTYPLLPFRMTEEELVVTEKTLHKGHPTLSPYIKFLVNHCEVAVRFRSSPLPEIPRPSWSGEEDEAIPGEIVLNPLQLLATTQERGR
jgi:hypothetical protein